MWQPGATGQAQIPLVWQAAQTAGSRRGCCPGALTMNTTLRTGITPLACTSCSTISPVVRSAVRPIVPVAQKVQPIWQPTCVGAQGERRGFGQVGGVGGWWEGESADAALPHHLHTDAGACHELAGVQQNRSTHLGGDTERGAHAATLPPRHCRHWVADVVRQGATPSLSLSLSNTGAN